MPCSGDPGNICSALELAIQLGPRLGWKLDALGAAAQLSHLGGGRITLTELALDGAHLLAQHVLSLRLRDLLDRLAPDVLLHLQDGELVLEQLDEPTQQRWRGLRLEELLARVRRERHAGRDEVGERTHVLQPRGRLAQLVGQRARQRHDLPEEVLHRARQRFGFGPGHLDGRRGHDPRHDVRLGPGESFEPDALEPLHDVAHAAVGHPVKLVDDGSAADAVEVLRPRRPRRVGRPHGDGGELPMRPHGVVDETDLAFVGGDQRQQRHREQHLIAQRQDAEQRRQVQAFGHQDVPRFGMWTTTNPRS